MIQVDEDIVRTEIQNGLSQVDSTFAITDFSCHFDPETRKLTVLFTAKNDNGEIVEDSVEWQ